MQKSIKNHIFGVYIIKLHKTMIDCRFTFRQWLPKERKFHYWGWIAGAFVEPVQGGDGATVTENSDRFAGFFIEGRAIYSGDVVSFRDGGDLQNCIVKDMGFCFYPFGVPYERQGGMMWDFGMTDLKLLGNIYEDTEQFLVNSIK